MCSRGVAFGTQRLLFVVTRALFPAPTTAVHAFEYCRHAARLLLRWIGVAPRGWERSLSTAATPPADITGAERSTSGSRRGTSSMSGGSIGSSSRTSRSWSWSCSRISKRCLR